MSAALLECPKCHSRLSEEIVNRPELTPCLGCGSPLQVEIFPALFRRFVPGRGGELLMAEGESSCFYHPQKKAAVPCQGCGRFLCDLCDCQFNGDHFCPACLETGRAKGKIKNLENERTLYDSIALGLAILPVAVVFGIYFTFITAPMAMYVAIRYWNAPRSIVRRTRARYIVAIIFASWQIIGWGVVIYFLATSSKFRG
jgi:hypothetical protein